MEIEDFIPHRLRFQPSHLESFLQVITGAIPVPQIDPSDLMVCRPNGDGAFSPDLNTITDYKHITSSDCFGCMCCVINPATFTHFISGNGAPTTQSKSNVSTAFIKDFFQGNWCDFKPNPNGLATVSTDETAVNNPIAAMLLWRLSDNPGDTYFCCSPNPGELGVETGQDPRRGELDIVIGGINSTNILFLEGKPNVKALQSSTSRDQWGRYQAALTLAKNSQLDPKLSFVIGGEECHMVPRGPGVPFSERIDWFSEYMIEDNKKYVTLEALRAMYLWKLFVNPDLTWQRHLIPLFGDSNFVGLTSCGVVMNRNGTLKLEKAPWV